MPATSPSNPAASTAIWPAEELINRKIDANRAVGKVAADLSKQTLLDPDAEDVERRAAAAEILNRIGRKALSSDESGN